MPTRRPVRPRDAAGLILLREQGSKNLQVLVGRRHAKARFMPGVYVFPGGGLDREDLSPSRFQEDLPMPPAGAGLDRSTAKRLKVFARTALRELWEETGYLLGTPTRGEMPADGQGVWRRYSEAGMAPLFASLRFVARAITPTDRPIRFNSRFFLCEDGAKALRRGEGDGELEDISWQPVEAVLGELPTPGITEHVLREALRAREAGAGFAPVRYMTRGERRYLRSQGGHGA